ncbi:heat-inducible transcriptional repressor HrcA [Ligilactobacillus cholophilus]|uniref:heat-inducible transcriptional repressor HrcA n=1 Tax=Ligilactobacillus cholophilus TaxID=3050131 RepID=UPI0025B13CF3|nr:heat-inducible transcriptional repressor HrcA [Ligilactobacillus cholophilus]
MLTDRQLSILKAIIRNYTNIGQPIGSKKLQEQLPIHVSSATIRNEMAALEHQGFLEKQHSSSGRIPSLRGYRYYVDNLLKPDKVDQDLINNIRNSFDNQFSKVDDIVALSAQLLSQMTNYVAISLKPESSDVVIEGFRLVPLHNRQVMILLVTSDGSVQSQTFTIPDNIHGDELESVIKLINDEIVGLSLNQVSDKLNEILPKIVTYLHQYDGFLNTFGSILDKAVCEHVYVSGKRNLLNFVNDDNLEEIKSLYSLIDHSVDLNKLLKKTDKDIAVTINDKDEGNSLDYSLVSATYDDGNNGHGLIAILGPTNMPYSKMIGMMDTFRDELSRRLINYYHDFKE